ncbi:hypothetical protein GDO86_001297 [Hymenochirus boettgeri]|uniref:Uncharacterized protein n=1 Tax=Hymenochirus boettgeri TaxID=247094 RepID=A0A8T2KF80_9PIPI|nr:hypothetical protein GDO86_001297 [Hymenochirus boettgeri]
MEFSLPGEYLVFIHIKPPHSKMTDAKKRTAPAPRMPKPTVLSELMYPIVSSTTDPINKRTEPRPMIIIRTCFILVLCVSGSISDLKLYYLSSNKCRK